MLADAFALTRTGQTSSGHWEGGEVFVGEECKHKEEYGGCVYGGCVKVHGGCAWGMCVKVHV